MWINNFLPLQRSYNTKNQKLLTEKKPLKNLIKN